MPARGAVVLFDKNPEEYPVFLADYEGQPRIRTVSPIHAREAENIAITGEGIFDGNGQLWRPLKQMKVTEKQWAACLKKSPYVINGKEGGIWMPTQSIYEGAMAGEPDVLSPDADIEAALKKASEHYDYYRPVMVSLVKCDRVLIEGVTLQNSPGVECASAVLHEPDNPQGSHPQSLLCPERGWPGFGIL